MFESNTDWEFDEIFGDSFQPDNAEAPKRTFENENPSSESNKKPCIDNKVSNISAKAMTFLKKIDENPNSITLKSETKPSSPFQSRSEGLFSPLRQDVLSSPMKQIVLRKFPGPAGLLPERKDFNIKAPEQVNIKDTKQVEMDICSQPSVAAFQEGPWEQMCKDFSASGSNRVVLLDKYNIAWIKDKMKSNKLINQKAPFLAAIVQKIECLKLKTPGVTMILKDSTGQIHGTIVHDLYEEYINVLKVGSVVILKQFGVLTTDRGSNHNLTITANNLVAIYSEEASQGDSVGHSHSKVNVTVIQRLSVEDFLKNINEVKSRHRAALLEQKLYSGGDFGGVHLNLKTMSEGSLSGCRTDFARMQTNENKSIQRDKFNTSTDYRTVNANSRSYSSSNIKSNTNLSSNFKNASLPSATNNSPVNLNKENDVGALNSSSCKQRFNFKMHTSHLNKQNDVVHPHPPIVSKFCLLESKSHPPTAGPKTQIIITNSNEDKREVINNNDSVIKCSQISVSSDNLEHSAILQNVFEGVDTDLLFEDFD